MTTTLTVTSDEPVTGPILRSGLAGLTSPDWQVVDATTCCCAPSARCEGDGRVYTITIRATDAAGQTSTANVPVIVPRYILPWILELFD